MITIYLLNGAFIDKTATTSDLGSQHIPMLEYLHNVLHGNASFPYTLEKGLGGSMYGAFFFTISNPLNLFVYFFNDIDTFINVLIIFKIGLCGLLMFLYLHHKEEYPNIWCFIFSLAYALMDYNIMYHIHFMWLDSVMMAPLVLWGIENIFNKQKDLLYIITLFVTIVLNYYTGYMVTVFSCLYFLYLTYIHSADKKWLKNNYKSIFHFFFLTLLIGLMTMFILLPLAYEVINYTRVDEPFKWINYNFLSLFASSSFGFGNLVNPLNYYGFLIYSGIVMLPLLVSYFSSKSIPKREKKGTAIVFLILLLPIIVVPLNALWHLFTFPQGFNYRYSFLATLFILVIALKSFKTLDGSKQSIKLFYIIYLIVSGSLVYVTSQTPEYYIYLTPLKIGITLLLLFINCYFVIKKKRGLILGALVLELILNLGLITYESSLSSKDNYYLSKDQGKIIHDVCPKDQRCETIVGNSLNDSLIGNYNGLTVFLSSLNHKPVDFILRANDVETNANYIYYNYSNMMLESILGVRYIGAKGKLPYYNDIKEYTVLTTPAYLEENPYALSLAYTVSPKLKDYQSDLTGFSYLEEIMQTMDDRKLPYLVEIPIKKIDDTTYVIDKKERYPYIYLVADEAPNNIDDNIHSGDTYGVIDDLDDKPITLTFDEKVDDIKAYTINIDTLGKFFESRLQMTLDYQDGHTLKGHISTSKDSLLFTSIPYEKGWTVYLDDKVVHHYEVLDTFIALDLPEGEHQITFKYSIPGFYEGLLVSLFSMAILMGLELKRRKL